MSRKDCCCATRPVQKKGPEQTMAEERLRRVQPPEEKEEGTWPHPPVANESPNSALLSWPSSARCSTAASAGHGPRPWTPFTVRLDVRLQVQSFSGVKLAAILVWWPSGCAFGAIGVMLAGSLEMPPYPSRSLAKPRVHKPILTSRPSVGCRLDVASQDLPTAGIIIVLATAISVSPALLLRPFLRRHYPDTIDSDTVSSGTSNALEKEDDWQPCRFAELRTQRRIINLCAATIRTAELHGAQFLRPGQVTRHCKRLVISRRAVRFHLLGMRRTAAFL
ncbi:hypothetical protein MRB53_038362 [Persea americana]|nr:hypothetical protein MRB53_038362 [Persea americana]